MKPPHSVFLAKAGTQSFLFSAFVPKLALAAVWTPAFAGETVSGRT